MGVSEKQKRWEFDDNLTHICLVDPSILINWTSPFPILGVSGALLNFYSILELIFLLANMEDPDQTTQNTVSDLGRQCLLTGISIRK